MTAPGNAPRARGTTLPPPASTLDGHAMAVASRAPVRAALVVVHPASLVCELALGKDPVELGRAADLRLDHETVSRRHLAITWESGGHVVRDLGSRNGARVDGVRLGDRPALLADQSVVQIGDVFAIYERGGMASDGPDDALPGRSPAIAAVRAQVAAAAPDPSPVLIHGETGTGKEWIARALHARSGRRGPLVAVNCATLGRDLLEAQLFGHLRGAFTGATGDHAGLFRAAEGGTLFLDELGELPLELQPKLLRALQDHEVMAVGATRAVKVDVRVCAATNRELAAEVERGAFRRDLHARLALWEIALPPLRARRVDLLDWFARLHRRWCAQRGRSAELALEPAAIEAILLHAWNDNLRGLERLVHALAGSGAAAIGRGQLPAWLGEPSVTPPVPTRRPSPTRDELERDYAELGGNVRALARRYGRDRKQIYRWLDAFGLARRAAP